MVQYNKAAVLGLISSLLLGSGQAFNTPSSTNSNSRSIHTLNPAARKMELARAKVESLLIGNGNGNAYGNGNEYTNLVESMRMVAGGAQAEEYYEGKSDSKTEYIYY